MRLFSLKDEIALVTGAGSGIGQGIAIGLAEAGADVALFDIPASKGLEGTARAVEEKGRRALIVTGDVVDGASLTAAVEKTEQTLGPPEIEAVPEALGLARATLRTIKQNLFWAFFYNALGVPLAACGVISPIFCAAAMGVSDLVVIGNALRLLRWKNKVATK